MVSSEFVLLEHLPRFAGQDFRFEPKRHQEVGNPVLVVPFLRNLNSLGGMLQLRR